MKKPLVYTGVGLAALLLLIQFVPVSRSNPPAKAPAKFPPKIQKILETACYDCHSNETKWPWYSYVAPVSWLVSHDVKEGREELNFSVWGSYSKARQTRAIHEIWEEIEKNKMPLKIYTYTHPKAHINDQMKAEIKKWAKQQK